MGNRWDAFTTDELQFIYDGLDILQPTTWVTRAEVESLAFEVYHELIKRRQENR